MKQDNFDLIIRYNLGDSLTPPPQPIPLYKPAVRTPDSITDAYSFPDFNGSIKAELVLCKIRGMDGIHKSG